MNPNALQKKLSELTHSDTVSKSDSKSLLVPDEQTYKKKLRETYFEKVYPHIEKFSFRSSFIQLSPGQIEALQNRHAEFVKSGERDRYNWLTTQELIKLEAQIDLIMKGLGTDLVFIRLSSRSPKDAAVLSKRFDNLFIKELRHLEDFEFNSEALGDPSIAPTTSENRKLHALCSAMNLALCCPNGKEAIELLVQSARIQGDLADALADSIPLSLIVREFRPFNVELEFRGFVVKKNLTALTQYNEYCYFPNLVYKKNYIQELIRDFWKDNLADAIPLDSYVVDFICSSESKQTGPPFNMKVTVVELNPFGEFASGGLFKWEIAHDKDVLLGNKPFEFRIAPEPPKDALQRLPLAWKDYILNPASPRRGSRVESTHAPTLVSSNSATSLTSSSASDKSGSASSSPATTAHHPHHHTHHHHHHHHENKDAKEEKP